MNAAAQRATSVGVKNRVANNAMKDLSDENKQRIAAIMDERYEPTTEQIDSLNDSFKEIIKLTGYGESNTMQEILRDNSKKGLGVKAAMILTAGEKAKEAKAKAQSNEPRIKVENDAKINVEDNTAKGREREAMNRASSAATKSGAKSTREKLLEAERKRQANIYRR